MRFVTTCKRISTGHQYNVRSLYGAYRIGDYSYGSKRHRYDDVLNNALDQLASDAAIYDLGCGTGAYCAEPGAARRGAGDLPVVAEKLSVS
jgi:hypothetical protein